MNNEYMTTWLQWNEDSFYMTYSDRTPRGNFKFVDSEIISEEKEKEILDLLNTYKNEEKKAWFVIESNPFYASSDKEVFVYFDDAESYYDERVDMQGGYSSYDDDNGGMDYSLESKDLTVLEFADQYAKTFDQIMSFARKEQKNEYIPEDFRD